jgi:hypothetical protein
MKNTRIGKNCLTAGKMIEEIPDIIAEYIK